MLCPKCANIHFKRRDKGCTYQHHDNVQLLAESYKAGCQLCTMIYHGLIYIQFIFGGKDDGGNWRRANDSGSEKVIMELVGDSASNTLQPRMIIVVKCSDRKLVLTMVELDEQYACLIRAENMDQSTGSNAAMELARIWLRNCINNHPECYTSTTSYLPSRVIDVCPFDHSDDVKLFCPGPESRSKAPYATLSHCWGDHQITMTTEANLVAHQTRISWDKLSLTFQNAIHVTRSLGIRYLWLDSLCIIQDSKEDWEMEAAVMGETYHNAMITISAAKAKDGRDGFFAERNAWAHRPCELNMYFSQRIDARPGEQAATHAPIYVYPFTHPEATGPLYSRAWVYQEQLLSQRTIAFGQDNMYWSCRSMNANENNPSGYPGGGDNSVQGELVRNIIDRPFVTSTNRSNLDCKDTDDHVYSMHCMEAPTDFEDGYPGDADMDETDAESKGNNDQDRDIDCAEEVNNDIHAVWYETVARYSKRDLTVPTDRLPAVAGIAAHFSLQLPDDRYVAGLWLGDIWRGLLWSCTGDDQVEHGHRAHPPLLYVAPSWSWAGLFGRFISYDWAKQIMRKHHVDEHLELLAIGRRLRGANLHGEISAAILKLSGRLIKVTPDRVALRDENSSIIDDLNVDEGKASYDCYENLWALAMVNVEDNEDSLQDTICLALKATGRRVKGLDEFWRIGIVVLMSCCFDDCTPSKLYLV